MNLGEIEKSVIGSIMLNEDKFQDVAGIVKPTDFFTESGCHAYLTISGMYGREPVNLQTVYMRADDRHKKWVLEASEQITSVNAAAYARIVADAAKKRRIAKDCAVLVEKVKTDSLIGPDDLLHDLLMLYRRELGTSAKKYDIASAMLRFNGTVKQNRQSGLGWKTGFPLLDQDFIYYRPGNLWVIGAWTSVGKTAWMVEAITRLPDARVAVFSTEMTEEQNIARMLANKTGVSANVILSGKMLDKHEAMVDAAQSEVAARDIMVVDDIRDVDEIAMQCRKMKHGGGIDVVFIDFIQNLCKKGYSKKYEMMSQIAIDLQCLAHELRCTVVCLSQLPNSAAKEDAGILEFKGAGEIAAACDVGVLMERAKNDKRVILFDIRKNRHGKLKKLLLKFDESWVRMDEEGESA